MLELIQFSLLDMTPYDRQSWFNLLSGYHRAVWPIHWLALLCVVALPLWVFWHDKLRISQHWSVRLVFAVLGLGWIWCGAVFHLHYFAHLNWAAPWFGGAFLLQGGLLWLTVFLLKQATWIRFSSRRGKLALVLLLTGLLVYPLSGLLEGRTLMQLEWFPLLPAAVTLVTFALLIRLKSRWRYALSIIPLLWTVISAAFAYTLGLLEFYFMVGVIIAWLWHFVMALG